MPRKSKDIGVIIKFDDKEYSYEETSLLWARLYSVFARIAEKEYIKPYFIKLIKG